MLGGESAQMFAGSMERPFGGTRAVHFENRIVLAGTIQAQIFGHHGRGDPAKLCGNWDVE
jgi:hypothetical protein